MTYAGPLEDALEAVAREYESARLSHAPMHSAHEGWAVIAEELDELWDHVKHDTAGSPEAANEAIQMAAMAIAFALEVCGWPRPDPTDELRRSGAL